MSSLPVENLQQRAIEQRQQLHQTTSELRAKIIETREQLSVKRNVRQHFPTVALIVAAVGLLTGYGFGDTLARR